MNVAPGIIIPVKPSQRWNLVRVKKQFSADYAKEFFDVEYLNQMLNEHLEGKANNARVIYTVYSFLLWYEQYFVLR